MTKGRGPSYTGGAKEDLYFIFDQKWSKLGTLIDSDATMGEMKKNFKNFYSVLYLLALTLTVYKEYINNLGTQFPS